MNNDFASPSIIATFFILGLASAPVHASQAEDQSGCSSISRSGLNTCQAAIIFCDGGYGGENEDIAGIYEPKGYL